MATINVKIFPEEKKQLLQVIRRNKGKTVSVAKLAQEAGQNPNRARFVLDELIEEGKVKKVPTKKFNNRYVRYSYEVL